MEMPRKQLIAQVADLTTKVADLEKRNVELVMSFPKYTVALMDSVCTFVCSEFTVLHPGTSKGATVREIQDAARTQALKELEAAGLVSGKG